MFQRAEWLLLLPAKMADSSPQRFHDQLRSQFQPHGILCFLQKLFLAGTVNLSIYLRLLQATENKQQFDEQAGKQYFEKLYEADHDYWYNRLRKVRKDEAANPELAAAITEAFEAFRMEAVRRKNA